LPEGGLMRSIACRLGRHRWEYLVFPDDDVVRWCPRCRSPKALSILPARRVVPPEVATAAAKVAAQVASDRPLVDLDPDALSAAAGMIAAIATGDDQGFNTLAKWSDPVSLTLSLVWLTTDADQQRCPSEVDAGPRRSPADLR